MLGSHGTAPWPDGVWGPRPDDSPSSRLRRRPLLALPATNGSARDPARARRRRQQGDEMDGVASGVAARGVGNAEGMGRVRV
nr:unnamed protein product [Digitaria exilis]